MSPVGERQLLSVMPLHAITVVYGEQGLRERLALEVGQLADPAARGRVRQALRLAGRLHAGDRRQREPYVNHLLRVALQIMVHYGVWEPEVICAALLHDAAEDHADEMSADGRAGAFALLIVDYGARVAELVAAVTNPIYAPGSDKDSQYRKHVIDSLAAGTGWRTTGDALLATTAADQARKRHQAGREDGSTEIGQPEDDRRVA